MPPLMDTGLLSGHVWHKRKHLKKHAFKYPVFYLLIDLDWFEKAPDSKPTLLSFDVRNIISVHQNDFQDGTSGSLKNRIIDACSDLGLEGGIDKVLMLTMPKVFGYAFNPITVYYCFSCTGELCAILYEVHNTFGEQHTYVCATNINGASGIVEPHTAKKMLHVSPFFDLQGSYQFTQKLKPNELFARIDYGAKQEIYLTAFLSMKRQELNNKNLIKLLLRIPFVTVKVIAAIHFEAARLWLKRVPFFRKPAAPNDRYSFSQHK